MRVRLLSEGAHDELDYDGEYRVHTQAIWISTGFAYDEYGIIDMNDFDKPIIFLANEITTPPMSINARRFAGHLLRLLQQGEMLHMPVSRPMPGIGRRCHELRISDRALEKIWRIIYRLDSDRIVVPHVFEKKSQKTPRADIDLAQNRLQRYDQDKAAFEQQKRN